MKSWQEDHIMEVLRREHPHAVESELSVRLELALTKQRLDALKAEHAALTALVDTNGGVSVKTGENLAAERTKNEVLQQQLDRLYTKILNLGGRYE